MKDFLIPYTTREDSFHYYEERNYVNDVNRKHTEVLQTYDREFKARETYTYGYGRASYLDNEKGDHYQYLTDQSGSVTGLTQDGNSVALSSYNLYGSTKESTDTTGNPFAYNGEARDITGLDYLRARYYDSSAGTFLTADSYPGTPEEPLSQNGYTYVENDPVNHTDPSGHRKKKKKKKKKKAKPKRKSSSSRRSSSRRSGSNRGGSSDDDDGVHHHRQQAVRDEYRQATGLSDAPKSREGKNIFKNWGKALAKTIKHVCTTAKRVGKQIVKAAKKINWKKVAAIGAAVALTISTGGSRAPVGNQRKNAGIFSKIFGRTEVTYEEESPEFSSQSMYFKTGTSISKPANGIIQGLFNNGKFVGGKLDLGRVSASMGLEGRNADATLSLNLLGHSISLSSGIGKDGVSIGVGHSNGVHSNEYGLNLNLDVNHGILGLYHKQGVTHTDNAGISTSSYVEQGVRAINGPVAGGIGLVAAGGMLVYSGGSATPVAVPLAATSIAAIIGSDALERNIDNE